MLVASDIRHPLATFSSIYWKMDLNRRCLANIFGVRAVAGNVIVQVIGIQQLEPRLFRIKISDGIYFADRVIVEYAAFAQTTVKFDIVRLIDYHMDGYVVHFNVNCKTNLCSAYSSNN